jgi:2-methylisocitrate lyase-like PEP mutase family enzyme
MSISPADKAQRLRALRDGPGVGGASIEDDTGDKTAPLYPIEVAAARIAAAVQAARALPSLWRAAMAGLRDAAEEARRGTFGDVDRL